MFGIGKPLIGSILLASTWKITRISRKNSLMTLEQPFSQTLILRLNKHAVSVVIRVYQQCIMYSIMTFKVLQLVNIARDIVTDSETLGRCYVPTEYMENEDKEIRILCTKKTPRSLGSNTLKKYSMRIIQLANKHKLESVDAIGWLPHETRGSVLAVIDIYHGLTNTIQSSPTYPTRASLSKWNKIWIAFYSLYIKSIQYVV